jgi:EAL domain-containing protein (putative c-di-GMP-specific phosphodiesterase class I)
VLPSNVPSPARMEGQRFAVVMPSLQTREEIDLLADKLRRAVQEPLLVGSRDLRLGAIVGVSVFPDDADAPVAIIRAAELALRHASVEAPVAYYQTELRDRAKSRLSLEIELRKALANGEFMLAYQPIVTASDSHLAGFEALVRWRHPEKGLQPPALFLPAIEELGLMADLDRWVLQEACRQTARWNATRDHAVWISVNVTAHSFRDPKFKSNVLETLRETGLAAEHLHLELTEQTALANVEEATALLLALREAGVAASLDDFGTGYSSLSQLQQLPVERIKLDRSFIANPDNLERDAAIVRALVTLAHTIRLDVVAEGVETDEQRCFCARAGVDLLQGYYFAAPLFPDKCDALLAGDVRLPAAA